MQNNYFTENMKLADIITANYSLVLMLPRFNIALGFGEKSVKEICERNGISVHFFLLICNVYTFDNYTPNNTSFTEMDFLVPYLSASHHYYMQERLPHIEHHLNKIADNIDEKYGTILKRFFTNYKDEVAEHFSYEEKTVFPYLNKMEQGVINEKYTIKEFSATHSNIEDKLNDLIQIIFKYLPKNTSSNESIELIFDIMQLSNDLKKHQLIEDKILIPYVAQLETKL